MPAGRPTHYDPAICEQAIELGIQGKSLTQIAVGLGIRRSTLYEWRDAHPEFADALKEAQAAALAWWESKGAELAFGDVKGSAAAFIFQMKNRFREDYQDRTELTGANGAPFVVGLTPLDERL